MSSSPGAAAPAPSGPPAASREQTLVLWIAIIGSFVSFLDGTVANVALPAIRDEFGGGLATQQWMVNAYLITLGALILVAGSVSDLYGRIRVLRVGIIGFGITSLAVAVAPTAAVLIAARLVQGAAGALLVPSSLALIMSNFTGAAQSKAVGVWTAATSAAMVIGPILGGVFVDVASWRWAFAINVLPIAAVLALLTRLEQKDTHAAGIRIDFLGAALGAAGLGGAVYALIEAPVLGWDSPAVWATCAAGGVLLACFLWRQATAAAPMMPLGLFRVRNFGWGNAATFMIYGALALISFSLGVYLQEGAGLKATAAGAASLPIILILIALSAQIGGLAGRLGPRLFMTAGPLVAAAGIALTLNVRADFNYWTQVLPGVVLVGLGVALTVSPLTSAILGAIGPAQSGIASAINNAVARIAGLLVVAMIGMIVGGQLDLDGFHRGAIVAAGMLVAGGVLSFVGIRNPSADAAET